MKRIAVVPCYLNEIIWSSWSNLLKFGGVEHRIPEYAKILVKLFHTSLLSPILQRIRPTLGIIPWSHLRTSADFPRISNLTYAYYRNLEYLISTVTPLPQPIETRTCQFLFQDRSRSIHGIYIDRFLAKQYYIH
jgi:hypothetical protein